jgi:uncharacterized integral membrane protein
LELAGIEPTPAHSRRAGYESAIEKENAREEKCAVMRGRSSLMYAFLMFVIILIIVLIIIFIDPYFESVIKVYIT